MLLDIKRQDMYLPNLKNNYKLTQIIWITGWSSPRADRASESPNPGPGENVVGQKRHVTSH